MSMSSLFMKDDRGKLKPSTEPILEAATKFLWDDMKDSLDSFCENHAALFAGAAPPPNLSGLGFGSFKPVRAPPVVGEQRLEWTTVHLEFQELFEFQLERFLETQPFSAEDFVGACQDALDNGSWANCRKMAEAIVAMPDYNNFVRMMSEAAAAAQEQQRELDAQRAAQEEEEGELRADAAELAEVEAAGGGDEGEWRLVEVTVPEGVEPGQCFYAVGPSGHELEVMAPADSRAGDVISVEVHADAPRERQPEPEDHGGVE